MLISCAESGCPGGMCAPSHYYASPKSIWSMGTPNYNKRKSYGSRGRRVRTHYKSPQRRRNIEYSPRYDFSTRNRGGNIEGGTFRSGYRYKKSANIEGGTFRGGYRNRRTANIEAGTFKTKGGYKRVANIESGSFGSNNQKFSYVNIENAPFKNRRTAKKRTSKFQKAIKYKEPKNKSKDSKYGLFPAEIEGYERRETIYKKRNTKPQKPGHGVKKIEE